MTEIDGKKAAPKWQDISTAPKDGTEILIFYKNYAGNNTIIKGVGITKLTKLSEEFEFSYEMEIIEYSEELDEYFIEEGFYLSLDDCETSIAPISGIPTHWMHLPQAPEVKDE